jgi:hypothetical protein
LETPPSYLKKTAPRVLGAEHRGFSGVFVSRGSFFANLEVVFCNLRDTISSGRKENDMSNIVTMINVGGGYFPAPVVSAALSSSPAARVLMLRDLAGIVTRTVNVARAAGRDYMSQSRAAAQAVMAVRPDFSVGQALDAVSRIRDMDLA